MIRFLSSVKLAVIVIVSLTVASIFATFYPQINVYGSIWFRALILLFAVNLTTCTAQRIPGIIARYNKKVDINSNFSNYEELQIQTGSENNLISFLKEKKYKTQVITDQGKTFVLGQKGFLSLIAPHLLHLSLIVVLIGAFMGTFGTEGVVSCHVDKQITIPSDIAENMSLKVNDFQTVYDHDGAIDNWVSDISLLINGEEVTRGTTRVNKPFKYKGIVFYQNAYGYTHLIEMKGEQEGFYSIPDGKTFNIGTTLFNLETMGGGVLVNLMEENKTPEVKHLKTGATIEFPDGTILEYVEQNPYTVLSVKVDPGTSVVMLGFLLMMIASMMFWFGRYREVNLVVDGNNNKLYLSVFCKNKILRQTIKEELERKARGGI